MIGSRLAARYAVFARREGVQATVRRRHTLKDQDLGKPLAALVLDGTYLAGATTIALRANNLEGNLPAGCVLQIGSGGPGPYQQVSTTNEVEAQDGVLSGVQLAAALTAGAADGTPIPIVVGYADTVYDLIEGDQHDGVTDMGEEQSTRVLSLVPDPAGGVPHAGDTAVLADGTSQRIADVRPVVSGGATIRIDVDLGSAR